MYTFEGRQQGTIWRLQEELQMCGSRMEVVMTVRYISIVQTCVGVYVSINNRINKCVRNLVCEFRIRSSHLPLCETH